MPLAVPLVHYGGLGGGHGRPFADEKMDLQCFIDLSGVTGISDGGSEMKLRFSHLVHLGTKI